MSDDLILAIRGRGEKTTQTRPIVSQSKMALLICLLLLTSNGKFLNKDSKLITINHGQSIIYSLKPINYTTSQLILAEIVDAMQSRTAADPNSIEDRNSQSSRHAFTSQSGSKKIFW